VCIFCHLVCISGHGGVSSVLVNACWICVTVRVSDVVKNKLIVYTLDLKM